MNCFLTFHFTDEETKAERLRHLPRAAGLGGGGDTNHIECSEMKPASHQLHPNRPQLRPTKMSITEEWIIKLCYIHTLEQPLAIKRKTTATSNNSVVRERETSNSIYVRFKKAKLI